MERESKRVRERHDQRSSSEIMVALAVPLIPEPGCRNPAAESLVQVSLQRAVVLRSFVWFCFVFSNVQVFFPPPKTTFLNVPVCVSTPKGVAATAGKSGGGVALASGPQSSVGVEDKHPAAQQKQHADEQSHDLPDEGEDEEEDEEERPGAGQLQQASPPADSGLVQPSDVLGVERSTRAAASILQVGVA